MEEMIELDGDLGVTCLSEKLAEHFDRYKKGEINEEEFDRIAEEIFKEEEKRAFANLEKMEEDAKRYK